LHEVVFAQLFAGDYAINAKLVASSFGDLNVICELRDGEDVLDSALAVVANSTGFAASTLALASTVSLDSDRPVTVWCRESAVNNGVTISRPKIVAIRYGDG
jgi:hypothetical protein